MQCLFRLLLAQETDQDTAYIFCFSSTFPYKCTVLVLQVFINIDIHLCIIALGIIAFTEYRHDCKYYGIYKEAPEKCIGHRIEIIDRKK
ncbi:hypothetical protein D3C80_1856820 [compost metagenome]